MRFTCTGGLFYITRTKGLHDDVCSHDSKCLLFLIQSVGNQPSAIISDQGVFVGNLGLLTDRDKQHSNLIWLTWIELVTYAT